MLLCGCLFPYLDTIVIIPGLICTKKRVVTCVTWFLAVQKKALTNCALSGII